MAMTTETLNKICGRGKAVKLSVLLEGTDIVQSTVRSKMKRGEPLRAKDIRVLKRRMRSLIRQLQDAVDES